MRAPAICFWLIRTRRKHGSIAVCAHCSFVGQKILFHETAFASEKLSLKLYPK